MKKFLALIMVVSMGVAACGDGNGGGGGGGGGGSSIDDSVAEQQASALAEQANESFTQLAGNPDDGKAIASVFTVYANALGVASAGSSAVVAAGDASASVPAEGDANVVDCTTTVGGTTTWDNCNYDGYTIDGTITVDGDDIELDLAIGFGAVTISFSGSITVTSSLIDGEFSVTSTVASVGFTLDVIFDAIEIVDGCAVGGSIIVDPSISAGQIRAVQADFGPACGDVTLYEY